MLDVARDFLRVRDVRDIAATCENEIAFESLRRFLLKVAVRARAGGKRRIIRDIVKRAGHISFKKGDVRLTVKVRMLICSRVDERLVDGNFCSNTILKRTTKCCVILTPSD